VRRGRRHQAPPARWPLPGAAPDVALRQSRPPASAFRKANERLRHGGLHQLSVKGEDQSVQHRLVQDSLREMKVVRTDRWVPLPIVGASIEVAATAAVVTAHSNDWPVAGATAGEPAEKARAVVSPSPPARHGVQGSPARRPLRFEQAHGLWQDRRTMAGAALCQAGEQTGGD
jgi:hypothetical protein